MEDYKSYLNESADEAERAAAKTVLEGLSALRIEAKVQEVAQQRKAYYQTQFRNRLMIGAVALVLLAAAWWFLLKPESGQSSESTPPSMAQDHPGDHATSTPDTQTSAPAPDNTTLAQTLPAPRFKAPRTGSTIRGGSNSTPNSQPVQKVLDQIWYTDYPLAGLRLNEKFSEIDRLMRQRDFESAYLRIGRIERQHADNDTLHYLKGYCLLELGQSSLASTHLNLASQKGPKSWKPQLQWYRALSMLHAGNQSGALGLFRKMAADTTHPYCLQSQKAMKLLE